MRSSNWLASAALPVPALLELAVAGGKGDAECTVVRRAQADPRGRETATTRHGRDTAATIASRRWLSEQVREVRTLTRMLRDQGCSRPFRCTSSAQNGL